MLIALVVFLRRPYPMSVQANAILEPVEQRSIYASADGLLEEIHVVDGQRVSEGQLLATMRSPSLELMVEEALGKLRAMAEKRNGLMVAISQSATSVEAESSRNRITSDLLILDAQEKHVRSTLDFLKNEQKDLRLLSPLSGVVVASEMKRELNQRPLKRGDPLFRVVRLDGDWQLTIQVADRDTHWVKEFYAKKPSNDRDDQTADTRSSSDGIVRVQFESMPEKQFLSHITRIENVTENHLGRGSFQQVTASVDPDVARQFHMGSTARVTFDCGEQPTWYVWCRPLIEFVQTRTGWWTRS
jgi:multidrug efflux pump subunit AcrA (membrane-fusion protein)